MGDDAKYTNPITGTISAVKDVVDIASGVTSMFGGGDEQQSGYSLPPEYELQFLDYFDQQMKSLTDQMKQTQSLYDTYQSKLTALDSIIGGGDRNEGLRALQESNYRLASSLGMSGEDLVKNGFISPEDKADLDKLSSMARGESQLSDPMLEDQLASQKRQLEQDLARSGASPAQRQAALYQFDQSANQQRFSRSGELGQRISANIDQRAGLRQQGFGMASNTLGQNLGFASGSLGALGTNAGNRFSGGMQNLQYQNQLGQQGLQNYGFMGQFRFSDRTSAALESGLVGPGSFYQQTGIGGAAMGDYRNWIATQERLASTGQSLEGQQGGMWGGPGSTTVMRGRGAYQGFKNYQTSRSGSFFSPAGMLGGIAAVGSFGLAGGLPALAGGGALGSAIGAGFGKDGAPASGFGQEGLPDKAIGNVYIKPKL